MVHRLKAPCPSDASDVVIPDIPGLLTAGWGCVDWLLSLLQPVAIALNKSTAPMRSFDFVFIKIKFKWFNCAVKMEEKFN